MSGYTPGHAEATVEAVDAGVLPPALLMQVAVEPKMWLRPPPSSDTATAMTTAIRPTSRPYSTAVAPLSDTCSRSHRRVATAPP